MRTEHVEPPGCSQLATTFNGDRREIPVTKSTRTTQRSGQVPDVRSVNPRYKGAKMSDMARALMRPQDPKVREAIEHQRSEKEAGK